MNKAINILMRGLVDLLIGLMWGDEGKGKALLELIGLYDLIVRYQGGPNAGHSLKLPDGREFVAHQFPSGAVVDGKILVLGNNTVVDPVRLKVEYLQLVKLGFVIDKRIFISNKSSFILPIHRVIDAAKESLKNKRGKIGTTKSGIGPAYADRANREDIRLSKVLKPRDFNAAFAFSNKLHEAELLGYIAKGFVFTDEDRKKLDDANIEFKKSVNWLRKKFGKVIIDIQPLINSYLESGKKILAEGAQGIMLDVLHGDSPFTTSSTTWGAGVFDGLGIGPKNFGKIYGVFKPYTTKVGGGPFPSRMPRKIEKLFQKDGHERGATTGRPRMCGFLDLVILRHSIEMHAGFSNEPMELMLMKTDVFPKKILNKPISVIVAYKYRDGSTSDRLKLPLQDVVGVITEQIHSWKTPAGAKTYKDAGAGFTGLINLIENKFSDIRHLYRFHTVGTGAAVGESINDVEKVDQKL